MLIVSNSAGTGSDSGGKEARLLQKNTGVTVLHHSTKKPGCQTEILDYFRNAPDSGVTRPDQIAVVGDRLFTDVMMANMMGSWGIWVRDGVIEEKGLVSLRRLLTWLRLVELTRHSLQDLKVNWQAICFAEATVHQRP